MSTSLLTCSLSWSRSASAWIESKILILQRAWGLAKESLVNLAPPESASAAGGLTAIACPLREQP